MTDRWMRSLGWTWPAVGLAPLLPGLFHGFYQDDFWWLEQSILATRDPAHLFHPWVTGFARPIGQASFFTQFVLFRFDPLPYNVTSLALHGWVGHLVWRLGGGLGLGRVGQAAAATMFLVGAGHFAKPVLWACSHPILLGTGLVLLTLGWLLEEVNRVQRVTGSPWKSGLLLVVGACPPLVHDLLGLAPLALGGFAIVARHPSRSWLGPTWGLIGVLYLIKTASLHAGVGQVHGFGWHVGANLLQYLATLVAPLSNSRLFDSLVPTFNGYASVADAIVLAVGFAVGALITLGVGRSHSPILAATLGVGLALLAPSLMIDLGRRWVDARYMYPAAAVLIPVLVCALKWATGSTLEKSRVRQWALLGTILWYVATLSGSVYMQRQAVAEGKSPKTAIRWERLELVRMGEVPP